MLVLGDSECLHQNVHRHVICPNQFEVDASIGDAVPDEIVSDINVLRSSMVHQISSKQVSGMVIDEQFSQTMHTFMKFLKEMA